MSSNNDKKRVQVLLDEIEHGALKKSAAMSGRTLGKELVFRAFGGRVTKPKTKPAKS